MSDKIKSGKDVINDFFSEILNIEGIDQKTAEKLVELHNDNKLTDTNIQNVLEELKQTALNPKKEKNNDND